MKKSLRYDMIMSYFTLEVEVNVVDGTGKLELTGNLGDVMKESAFAAMSFIRSRAKALVRKSQELHICDTQQYIFSQKSCLVKPGSSFYYSYI